MTEQEYDKKVIELEEKHIREQRALMAQYAKELVQFKVGDIISAPIRGIIRIEKIGIYKGLSKYPEPKYTGIALTKQLMERKDNQTAAIFGSDSDIVLIKSGEVKRKRTK